MNIQSAHAAEIDRPHSVTTIEENAAPTTVEADATAVRKVALDFVGGVQVGEFTRAK